MMISLNMLSLGEALSIYCITPYCCIKSCVACHKHSCFNWHKPSINQAMHMLLILFTFVYTFCDRHKN